ncbi:MAG: hypothetical protein OIF58_13550 [Cohaesibacter sp.]|nr:hypothetical protein [Cohaesibacter sp.]
MLIEEGVKSPQKFYSSFIVRLGFFFANASKIARRLVAAIAIGGSFLVVDQIYTISFISWFEPLDDIVKRSATVLVIITMMIYYATMMGSRIARVVIPKRDSELRRIELHFYFSILALLFSSSLLTIGLPVEGIINSSGKDVGNITLPTWPLPFLKFFGMMSLVSLVWIIATLMFVLSRIAELRAVNLLPAWLTVQPEFNSSNSQREEEVNATL